MTGPIPGIPAPALLPETGDLARDGIVAAQESPDLSRQAVLRRVHDVLNLSVLLAQPLPEGLRRPSAAPPAPDLPPKRQMGWAEWGQIWAHACASGTGAALGEARLFLARLPAGGTGPVAATAALGQSVEPLLPYREDRTRGWWGTGTTTSAGYAVWDTHPADTDSTREIIALRAPDDDAEFSAWAWSDGPAELPPFARYLMHAAKVRFEARLLDSWGHGQSPGDLEALLAELSVVLAPEVPHPGQAELLRSRLSRLQAEEGRLNTLEGDLKRLSITASMARGNLAAVAGRDAAAGAHGLFASDQALARWLTQQVQDYLGYLRIDLDQTRRTCALAEEKLRQAGPPGTAASPANQASPDIARRVFMVYGRDNELTSRFFDLLRSVDLRPMEWEHLIHEGGRAMPTLAQVVALAPSLAQATLVLLSPDDVVEVHSDLVLDSDGPQERERGGQARPNVLFELGLALMANPDRTIVVDVGRSRPVSDLAGFNMIRFDGSAEAIRKVLHRLEVAGCPVDYSGVDWLNLGRFAGLRAYQRGPRDHKPAP
jgi:predicted nucleotide-binding protein